MSQTFNTTDLQMTTSDRNEWARRERNRRLARISDDAFLSSIPVGMNISTPQLTPLNQRGSGPAARTRSQKKRKLDPLDAQQGIGLFSPTVDRLRKLVADMTAMLAEIDQIDTRGLNWNEVELQIETALADLIEREWELQKQLIGDRLHPLVQARRPEFADSITSKLLEMDNTDLIQLFSSKEALESKIEQALTMLLMPALDVTEDELKKENSDLAERLRNCETHGALFSSNMWTRYYENQKELCDLKERLRETEKALAEADAAW